jgi:hypothetical protein
MAPARIVLAIWAVMMIIARISTVTWDWRYGTTWNWTVFGDVRWMAFAGDRGGRPILIANDNGKQKREQKHGKELIDDTASKSQNLKIT